MLRRSASDDQLQSKALQHEAHLPLDDPRVLLVFLCRHPHLCKAVPSVLQAADLM